MELDKLHILFGSDLDALTLTTVPAADAGFPETHMQKSARGKFLRVTDVDLVVKGSVGGADPSLYASGFALGRHNLKNDATVQIRLYDAINQGGNVVYDSGAQTVNTIIPWGVMRPGIDPWGASYEDSSNIPKLYYVIFDTIAYKSMQIDVAAPSNTTIDVGRLFLKAAWVPRVNYSYGSELEWEDGSVLTRTSSGGLKGEKREPYRRFVLPLDWIDETDQERLSREMQEVGKTFDVLVIRYPNAGGLKKLEQTMFAMRTSNNKYTFNFHNNHSQELVFEET